MADSAMAHHRPQAEFRYFMGVCKGMLSDRAKQARDIIGGN